MKKYLLIFLIICIPSIYAQNRYLNLTSLGQEQYQDIYINGTVVSHGIRGCADRYAAILPILKKYKRPITVLDLGASQGYFSFRIAHEFKDAVCVMIEGNYNNNWKITEQLEDLCYENTELDNIIFLKKNITSDDLHRLAECEHFDVVLAFNIIHHYGDQWQHAADAILKLGDHIIIETPSPEEKIFKHILPALHEYLTQQHGTIIGHFPRHTSTLLSNMFLIKQKKKSLTRISWFHGPSQKPIKISSTYKEKYIYHPEKKERTVWKPGINLSTFLALNGVFPHKQQIIDTINLLPRQQHGDFTAWNLIIQGQRIHMIDETDSRHILDPDKCHDALTTLLNQVPSNNIEKIFIHYFAAIQNALINPGGSKSFEAIKPLI